MEYYVGLQKLLRVEILHVIDEGAQAMAWHFLEEKIC